MLQRAAAASAAQRSQEAAAAVADAAAERAALVAEFGAVADDSTIGALLEDQGNDALAVRAMLKRMRREHKVRHRLMLLTVSERGALTFAWHSPCRGCGVTAARASSLT